MIANNDRMGTEKARFIGIMLDEIHEMNKGKWRVTDFFGGGGGKRGIGRVEGGGKTVGGARARAGLWTSWMFQRL